MSQVVSQVNEVSQVIQVVSQLLNQVIIQVVHAAITGSMISEWYHVWCEHPILRRMCGVPDRIAAPLLPDRSF